MKQIRRNISVATAGKGFTDLTPDVARFIADTAIGEGVLTLFIPHTSASLVIQENADRDVLKDLEDAFARLAPREFRYRHDTEGPDDMPSHIKAALTATSLSIPVGHGRALLGVWQAIYLFEHRDAPHAREIVLHVIGDPSTGSG